MSALYKWLTLAYGTRLVVLTLSIATILAVSSWIDLRTVKLWQQILRALPNAACIAAVWTVLDWRRQGGIIALSASGCSPWVLIPWVFLVAVPPFAIQASEVQKNQTIQFGPTPGELVTVMGSKTYKFTWNNGIVSQTTDGQTWLGGSFTEPKMPASAKIDSTYLLPFLRCLLKASLLLWLVNLRRLPRMRTCVLCTAFCIGLTNALPWFLTQT
ncbi:MAG: hypothetical protein VYA30_05600 [Myxococcota bacterium]|nr:hypothetical protein [Myxococcota bacterium]